MNVHAKEINPNTPPELIDLALEALNARANIGGEVSYIKQIRILNDMKKTWEGF